MIFSDNFDAENGGQYQLNYHSFAKWNVMGGGSVDLIANGYFSGSCPGGSCVNLHGSSNLAGILTSKQMFDPGNYIVQFELSDNPSSSSKDAVEVTLGNRIFFESPASTTGFITFSIPMTITSPAPLTFRNISGDNIGAILDNVQVSSVPIPAAIWLLGSGFIGLIGIRKNIRR